MAAVALTAPGLLAPVPTPAAGAPPAKSERPVYRMTDLFGPGEAVPVGSSKVVRTASGLSARLRSTALTPGTRAGPSECAEIQVSVHQPAA